MPTKKSTTVKKSTKSATSKKTIASKKTAAKQPVTNTSAQTRVVCPECGAEFDILAQHEHTVQNATVIGADSGMGTIYLPVSKRGDALKAAGIDISKYFSIQLPNGGSQWMRMGGDGVPVAVAADDPVLKAIASQGTVPNRSLFRRWIMSQMFHALQSSEGITGWMAVRGYDYQWRMFIEELRVQAKLYGRDMENFRARNRWFNKQVAVAMAGHFVEEVMKACKDRPQHKCKGTPYIKFDYKDVFVDDIRKKIIEPISSRIHAIRYADSPQKLYEAVKKFWYEGRCKGSNAYDQCPEWKDAFKGAGAYFTMQNLLRFHGALYPLAADFGRERCSDLEKLEKLAGHYKDGEGFRLIGVMKLMLRECGIDIDKKMQEWSKAKAAKQASK